MSVTMYDSVTANDIPANATDVAGYVTGHYAWTQAEWDRFTAATRKVEICTNPAFNIGDVIDCEKGDATPDQAADWVITRISAGLWKPTVYFPLSAYGDVLAACHRAGLTEQRDFDCWAAHYTGKPHTINGCVAVQYADPNTSGGHYDLSFVADDAWPYRTKPQPTPAPTPPRKKRMERLYSDATGHDQVQVWDNGWRLQVLADGTTSAALQQAGVPLCPIGPDDLRKMVEDAGR